MKKYPMYVIAGIILAAGLVFASVAIAEPTASTSETSVPTITAEVNPNSAYAAAAEYQAEVARQQQLQVDEFFAELARQQQAKAAAPAAAAPQREYASADGTGRWDQLAQCEAGGNWATNTGNGFGGGLQFMHQRSYSTWLSYGGGEFAPHPWEASREQQIVIAERILEGSGWRAWPGCSRKFGWL